VRSISSIDGAIRAAGHRRAGCCIGHAMLWKSHVAPACRPAGAPAADWLQHCRGFAVVYLECSLISGRPGMYPTVLVGEAYVRASTFYHSAGPSQPYAHVLATLRGRFSLDALASDCWTCPLVPEGLSSRARNIGDSFLTAPL